MRYSIDKKDDYVVLRLDDDRLDTVNAPELKTELALLVNDGFKYILLNLEPVEFIDSSGLSAILVGNRACSEAGGLLLLVAPQPAVRKLITISKLDDLLKSVPTLSEARDYAMMVRLEREIMGDGEEPASADSEEIDA